MKEHNSETEVRVGLEILWQALSKDLTVTVPKAIPNIVKEVQVLEGDGGLGTIFHFTFFPGVAAAISHQKEKISELDVESYAIGLEVIEGGYLNKGFSYYNTRFQLFAIGEAQTLVKIKISYESADTQEDHTNMPLKTAESTVFFLSFLEKSLLNE